MPITIPEFVQFQAPLYPLRGLWNSAPAEGDRFINAEIDWGSPGLLGVSCVQFQLSGNSPVAFSQIVAMSVDNSRCGSSVDFIYPDSGFILTVPAFNQGVYPVFTNALMFYASAPAAALGDITITQILNSQPPPVAIQPAEEQSAAAAPDIPMNADSTTPLVPAPLSGTVQSFTISISTDNATAVAVVNLRLIDGTGAVLFQTGISVPVGPYSLVIPVSGVRLRFTNGLSAVLANTAGVTSGNIAINLYYSLP